MTYSQGHDRHAASWKRHLAKLTARAISCDRCVVYDVDHDLTPRGHTSHDDDGRWVDKYTKKFLSIDPLRPELFAGSADNLIVTGWNFSAERLHRSAYYEGFMRPLGQRHKAEMFFRNARGQMIGGVRIARSTPLGPFNTDEISLLNLMQPVLEGFAARGTSLARNPTIRFGELSRREREVVHWVAEGLSNKEICRKTNTSLPTVKCQIASAYRKLGINKRSELISLFHTVGPVVHDGSVL